VFKRIKDFINRHKVRKEVDKCWEDKPKVKVKLKPEYNINNIIWYQTIYPDIMLPYFYNRDEGKPIEQYYQYGGINNQGYVTRSDYLETIH